MRFLRRILSHSVGGPMVLALLSAGLCGVVLYFVLSSSPSVGVDVRTSLAALDSDTSLDDSIDDTEETLDGSTNLEEDDTTTDTTEGTIDDTLNDATTNNSLDDTTDETEDTTTDTEKIIDDETSDDTLVGDTTSTETSGETTQSRDRNMEWSELGSPDSETTNRDSLKRRWTRRVAADTDSRREQFDARRGILVEQDMDDDGVSDYDEIHLYGTDPRDPRTAGGVLSDGERVVRGLDLHASDRRSVAYEDVREASVAPHEEYRVERVVPSDSSAREVGTSTPIVLRGRALPNVFVTLYIYSTPIIVTTKADETGAWAYTLEQELPDGEHRVYAATVDNSGKIVARSEPLSFVKQGAAVRLLRESGASSENVSSMSFMADHYIVVAGLVLVVGLFVTIVVIGVKPWARRLRKRMRNST